MKRGRLSAKIATLCVPALALGLGVGVSAAASAARVSPARTASQLPAGTVVINCLGKPQVRPGSLGLACADGTQHENDCIPDCAGGHFHGYPVLAVLWGSAPVSGHPALHRYAEITLIYPGARPKVYNGHRWVTGPVTVTMPLWGPPR